MCQALADGGRRCPIHRHDTAVARKLAQEVSGLNTEQVNNLFNTLRREGRHRGDVGEERWHAYLDSLRLRTHSRDNSEDYATRIDEAQQTNSLPDGATFYALQRLHQRAAEQGVALNAELENLAELSPGLTVEEVRGKFQEAYDGLAGTRIGVNQGYTLAVARRAERAGYPRDKATVVALMQVRNQITNPSDPQETDTSSTENTDRRPRITRSRITRGGIRGEMGYDPDGGRLEIALASGASEDLVLRTYRNVPESVWEEMSNSSHPVRVFNNRVRTHSEYWYESAEQAAADGHAARCQGCGQFVSNASGHSCPVTQRVETEAARAETPLTPAQVSEVRQQVIEEVERVEEAPAPEVVPEPVNTTEEAEDSEVAVEDPSTEEPQAEVASAPDPNALTVEQQLHPAPYESPGLVPVTLNHNGQTIETAEIVEFNQSNINTNLSWTPAARALAEMDELQREMVQSLASNPNTTVLVRYVPTYMDRSNYAGPSVVHMFNHNESVLTSRDGLAFVRPRGLVYEPEENPAPDLSLDDAPIQELGTTSSRTSRYTLDGQTGAPGYTMRYVYADALRRELNAGNIAGGTFEMDLEGGSHNQTDDQGYEYHQTSGRVTGHLYLKKNEDGTVSVARSTTLRCSCRVYRRNYDCKHLNYVRRHMGNVGQQMVNPIRRPRASTPQTLPGVDANSPLNGSAAVRRLASEGIISEATDSVTGDTVIAFSESRRYQRRPLNSVSVEELQEHIRNGDWVRVQEVYENSARYNRSVFVAPPATQVSQALAQGDVLVPVEGVRIAGAGRNNGRYGYSVNGNVLLHREDDGTITASARSLRCYCPDYRDNYDCEHVRETVARAPRLLADPEVSSRRALEQIETVLNRHRAEREEAYESVAYARAHGVSLDAARSIVEEERAAARRAHEEAVQRRQEASIARYRAENEDYIAETAIHRQEMKERWKDVEPGYVSDPGSFYADYAAALSRKTRGEEVLPYQLENVTDGICADTPGARKFGIELEFSFENSSMTWQQQRDALSAIGKDLYEAGLTNSRSQQPYHSAARNGYDKWSFEEDGTVDGEIVSPLMSDTPQHWRELQQVVEIIKRHGGTASTSCGSHVHVSTGSYGQSSAKHAELLRTVNENEDVLYRLASSPSRGRHRGTQWCAPNVDDTASDFIASDALGGTRILATGTYTHNSHNVGLNFEGAARDSMKKSNVEFRMWDGTLDASVIQQQVKISAALTEYAERKVEVEGGSTRRSTRQRIGSGRTKERQVLEDSQLARHNEESFVRANGSVGSLMDALFRKKSDRQSVVSLFAITNWQ